MAYTHCGPYYDSIPLGTSDDIHKILWRDAAPYLFGIMTGEILHENFVFGGSRGFHLVMEGGLGPSGHCLGMGVDQCTNAMQITGGSVSVAGKLAVAAQPGATGLITLTTGTLGGGTIDLAENGLVNLSGGTLVLDGDVRTQVSSLADDDRIVAFGGAGVVKSVYNTTDPGRTTVTGTPPALATTHWNASSPGKWPTNADWTGGIAPLDVSQHIKVLFNVANTAPCTLDGVATVGQLVMGDSNPVADLRLTLATGANLTAWLDAFGRTNWTAIGYNRNAAMSVGTCAFLRCRNHLWIGHSSPAVGKLEINGGTVAVDGQFGLGRESGTGLVTIRKGGTLSLNQIATCPSTGGSSYFQNTVFLSPILNTSSLPAMMSA